MSDTRDEATGQFAAEPEQLFGKAGIEHDAGYVPMPEEKEEPEELTAREAAEILAAQSHTAESDIQTYTDGVNLPDNVTMTVEQAAKALTDAHEADAKQAELDKDEAIRKEVDELRGVKPEAEEGSKQPAQEAQSPKDGELDPEIEKALSNPKVKEAIAAQINEAESVRHTYSKAVDTANDFACASFIENFPEIAGLPLEQWEGALAAMAQREPDRFNRAVGTLNRVVQLQAAQQQQQQQRAAVERQQFEAYSKEQDAIFADKTKDIPAAQMRAIEAELPKMLKEYGADARQFLEAIGNQSAFPRAAAERIMVDAAKYRLLIQAPKAVAAKNLPPVHRPGVRGAITSSRDGDISSLDGRLSATGSIKDAVALYTARKARG